MKLYGNLFNRLEENNNYAGEIKVGTYVTEYMYSDRHAYEVVDVKDQNNISIRRLDAIRADDNGMSDDQHYKYEQNLNNPVIDLTKRNNVWYEMNEISKESLTRVAQRRLKEDFSNGTFEMAYGFVLAFSSLTDNQKQRIEQGKTVKKYVKFGNLSFGVADEYYDYEF